mmetsp:Transcript_2090/g.5235  ORF Transcript_2090/g.5235 Transcript_2090/m.5235 type:complete len:234 (+) Transcript_2090:55-756(+)
MALRSCRHGEGDRRVVRRAFRRGAAQGGGGAHASAGRRDALPHPSFLRRCAPGAARQAAGRVGARLAKPSHGSGVAVPHAACRGILARPHHHRVAARFPSLRRDAGRRASRRTTAAATPPSPPRQAAAASPPRPAARRHRSCRRALAAPRLAAARLAALIASGWLEVEHQLAAHQDESSVRRMASQNRLFIARKSTLSSELAITYPDIYRASIDQARGVFTIENSPPAAAIRN